MNLINTINLKADTMKKLLPVIAACLVVSGVKGQENHIPDVFSPSPNVAEMNKYLEQPVNTSTGIPSIQIPVYTIKSGDIQIPISIDYFAGGIKVDQEASNVGLGWSLNAGGNVNREERDFIDDIKVGEFGGFMFHKYGGIYNSLINHPVHLNPIEDDDIRQEINGQEQAGNIDNEADLFSYNIITSNGQFIYDQQDQQFYQLERKNHKIEYSSTELGKIYQWIITDERGVRYIFGELNGDNSAFLNPDYSETNQRTNVSSNSGVYTPKDGSIRRGLITWYLREIIDQGGNKITFEYAKMNSVVYFQMGPGFFFNGYPVFYSVYNAASTNQLHVSKISFNNGEVEFVMSNDLREDLYGSKRLTSIKIYSKLNNIKTLIKQVNLNNNDYFLATETAGTNILNPDLESYLRKRLKLNSVDIINVNNSSVSQTYKFEYDMTQLPQKLSYSKDYWGGYNGESNNSLAPELIGTGFDNVLRTFNSGGARRSVNRDYVTAGMLTKVIYPTKGYTQYEYEPNTISSIEYMSGFITDGEFVSVKNIKNPYIKTPHTFDTYIQDLGEEGCECEGCCTREILSEDMAIYRYKFTINKPLQSAIKLVDFYADCLDYSTPGDPDDPTDPGGDTENPSLPEEYSYDCNYNYRFRNSNGDALDSWFYLTPGDYYAEIIFTGDTSILGSAQAPGAQLKIAVYEDEDTNVRVVGGVRVKSISNYDADNSLISKQDYKYEFIDEDNIKFSSGISMLPKLGKYEERIFDNTTTPNNPISGIYIFSDSNLNPSSMVGKTFYNQVQVNKFNIDHPNIYTRQIDTYPELWTQFFSLVPNSEQENMNLPFPLTVHVLKNMDTSWMVGNSYQKEYKNQNGETVKTEVNIAQKASYVNKKIYSGFKAIGLSASVGTGMSFSDGMAIHYFNQSTFPIQLWNKIFEESSGETIINRTDYQYTGTNPLLPSSQTTTNSLGETLTTKYEYPQDLAGQRPYMSTLVAENRIAQPVRTKTYNNVQADPLSVQETVYEKNTTTNNLVLPKYIFAKKNSDVLNYSPTGEDLKITYDKYDTQGNLQQYTMADGTPVSIIWGYNKQYPIAKVEGVAYSTIASQAATLAGLSDSGDLTETSFETLRNTAGALVTCYIYEPLVGVTSIILPNGQTEYYEYDDFGRLKEVYIMEGGTKKILKTVDYNYAH